MRGWRKGLDLMSVRAHWDAEGASETEIGEFKGAVAIDEEVLGLQVAVENAATMAEEETLEQLLAIALQDV